MNKELISIIIPIYNIEEEYLTKCLETVINQTYSNLQIILVNDGSTNNSGEICNSYARKCDKIEVIHQENKGVSEARNIGIKKSKGEWIMFIDPDDWVEKNIVEELYKETQKCSVDIVMGDSYINYIDRVEKNQMYEEDYIFNDETKEELQLQNLCKTNKYKNLKLHAGTACIKLFKKELIIKNNLMFVKNLKKMEDNLFCLYAFEYSKKIIYISKGLYHYRKRETSACNKYSPTVVEDFENFFNEVDKFIYKFSKKDIFNEYKNVKIVNSIYSYMRLYFFNKNKKEKYKFTKRKIIILLKNEPYKSAFKNVKYRLLTKKQKIYFICLKLKIIYIFYIFFKKCNRKRG